MEPLIKYSAVANMKIARDTVVSINYELSDANGKLLEKTSKPISYLHGGYHGMFPMVEEALQGKSAGDSCKLTMDPQDAFGEYDSELVCTEPRHLFPENVAVGMQFEGGAEGSDDVMIYTVTEVAQDKVVVDGNHPLAGQTLNFSCTVTEVRAATPEEITHGHVHREGEHHH
jgi:FKBP-type peptidyl-prolyl cis-trans isomerase SlyD